MGEDKKKLGKRIREFRKKSGLSQLELAKAVKKESASYIAFLESGDRNVSAVDLMLIANALGLSVSELLGETNNYKGDFKYEMRSKVDLNDKDKETLIQFYEYLRSKNGNKRD